MPPASSPDIRMTMLIPIHRCFFDGFLDFSPALKTASFECQRFERLPPRLDQVEIGGVRGLKDEFPAWIGQIEEKNIHGAMHRQIIQDDIDPLHIGWRIHSST